MWNVELRDTGRVEAFRSACQGLYTNVNVVFLVYAVNDKESFEKLSMWLREVDLYTRHKKDTPRVIIGNKIDVDDRVISREEGEAYAANFGVPYLETSAKTGQNVQEIMKLAFQLSPQENENEQEKHGCCSLQ